MNRKIESLIDTVLDSTSRQRYEQDTSSMAYLMKRANKIYSICRKYKFQDLEIRETDDEPVVRWSDRGQLHKVRILSIGFEVWSNHEGAMFKTIREVKEWIEESHDEVSKLGW